MEDSERGDARTEAQGGVRGGEGGGGRVAVGDEAEDWLNEEEEEEDETETVRR